MGNNRAPQVRKPLARRRSHKRKTIQERVINMAEARREIAHVLQLHRSSSTSTSSTTSSGTTSCSIPNVSGKSSGNRPNGTDYFVGSTGNYSQCHCYTMVDALPTLEPVWSTTAPSILAAPPQGTMPEAPEFDLGIENQAASYSWWLGFLRTLDSSASGGRGVTTYPCIEGEVIMDGDPGRTLGHGGGPAKLLDPRDESSFPDEWLIFPTTGDQVKVEK